MFLNLNKLEFHVFFSVTSIEYNYESWLMFVIYAYVIYVLHTAYILHVFIGGKLKQNSTYDFDKTNK